MIEKDKTILNLLDRLSSLMQSNDLQVVDYWDADFCAIGLRKGHKLVYISSYNYFKEQIVKYDYDFEIIDESQEDHYEVLEKKRSLTEDEIIMHIEKLFKD